MNFQNIVITTILGVNEQNTVNSSLNLYYLNNLLGIFFLAGYMKEVIGKTLNYLDSLVNISEYKIFIDY